VWDASDRHKVRQTRDQIVNDKIRRRAPAKFAALWLYRVYPAFELRLSLSSGFIDTISHKVTVPGYHFARCFARDRQQADYSNSEVSCSAGLPSGRTIRFPVTLSFIPKLWSSSSFMRLWNAVVAINVERYLNLDQINLHTFANVWLFYFNFTRHKPSLTKNQL